MKRNPRKLAWTKAFRRAHGKEMTVDTTLTFASRRNVPVRYDRELVATTLKAMQRVAEIRAKRERAFYKNRMKGNRARQLEADRKLVAENQHLLPPSERDIVPALLRDTEDIMEEVDDLEADLSAEEMEDSLDEEEDVLDEVEKEEIRLAAQRKKDASKKKSSMKQKTKLVRGGGVERMDVD